MPLYFRKRKKTTNNFYYDIQRSISNKKPVIGMIHTGSTDEFSMLDLAKKEIEIYLKYGVVPLIENYFG